MSSMERLTEAFWQSCPKRLSRVPSLCKDGVHDPAARRELKDLVHTLKGEAQLLGIEPGARVLELTDDLIRRAISGDVDCGRVLPLAASALGAMAAAGATGDRSGSGLEQSLQRLEAAVATPGEGDTP